VRGASCIETSPRIQRQIWTLQQFREAISSDYSYRFLIRDRDSIFSTEVDQQLKPSVSAKRTPSCKDSRRIAMLRHDQALKEGLEEVAKAGFRAGT